jgi:uncharacterized protein involved in outer membrane biogenesis
MRITRLSSVLAAASGALILVLALGLTLMDWNLFKRPIERIVSVELGRPVTIAGSLALRVWSRTPGVTLTGLTIGTPWEPDRPLVRIGRAQIQWELGSLLLGRPVARQLELDDPEIYLHQERTGRANWTLPNPAPSRTRVGLPFSVPAIRDLIIKRGRLVVLDELRRSRVEATLEARDRDGGNDPTPLRVEGKGTINDRPFRLDIAGGPLQALSPHQPYPFAVEIVAGDNQIQAQGRVLKPFDPRALELQVDASGRDLAELFYLTRITLPNSPPYRLQAHIVRNGMQIHVSQIAGSLGSSQVSGTVDIDASTKRPVVKADLVSSHLLLKDLAAITGSDVGGGESLDAGRSSVARPDAAAPVEAREGAASARPAAESAGRLFPDAHLQVERLRAIDADVHFRATSIVAGTIPFTQVELRARLDGGSLTLAPVQFELPQGRLSGTVQIDARSSVPQVHAELRAADVQLSQFRRTPGSSPPLEGTLDAHAVIEGSGDSVHNVVSDATGSFTAIVAHGAVRAALAELTGVDVAKGVGLLLKKGVDHAPIRCGVARFDLEGGTAHAREVVVDTQDILIRGSGRVYLGTERLDLTLQGAPKAIRLVRLRTPVEIRGQLLEPTARLETGHLLKQGAIGATLGTLLTPPAAILAFVDPGLAKDQDCVRLLAQVQGSSGSPTVSRSD